MTRELPVRSGSDPEADPVGADPTGTDPVDADPTEDAGSTETVEALADASLGGGGESLAPYHPLALDPEGKGFWGWVDRTVARATTLLNPILVKEARQSLKSKQFVVTFFLLLTASCLWTVMAIVFNSPDVYFVPSGDSVMGGYFVILSVSMFAFVPIVAFRSLAAELDEGTYEMLAITRLSAWRIVSGKMNSAMLQMLIYFSAIVPCLAFTYLLRGIGVSTIALCIAIAFVVATVLTSLGLVLSTVAKGRTLQTFLLVGLVAFIVIVEFWCCGIVFSGVIPGRWSGTWFGFLSGFGMAFSFVILFLAAASASIAPMTENRSTRLRVIMFGQQIFWIVTMSYTAWSLEELEFLNVGLMFLAVYWFFAGMLMLGESNEISPRVRRGLPSTFGTRALFSWWMPGPGTGFMFVVSTACAGMIVLGLTGMIAEQLGLDRSVQTPPWVVALSMMGLLVGYLGAVRLLSMPFLARVGPTFVVPLVIAISMLFVGPIVPCIIDVILGGEIAGDYTVLHAFNWSWTFIEIFDNGIPMEIAAVTYAVGMMVLLINLISLFREFRRFRIAVPRRVLEDRAADEPSGSSAPTA
ncbi:MAG: ABC transporter permease [Planctomycetota bacterium]